jgi:ribosome-binding factor A
MADLRRSHRLARQLQAELALLVSGEVDDPRVGRVSVTDVRLSRDLHHARIFVHCADETSEKEKKALLEGLDSARGFLRAQLSHRLAHLRRTPELTFVYDTSLEAGMRVQELLEGFESDE